MIRRNRNYPREIVYRYPYPKEIIKIANELKQDEEFLRRYELYKQGIDYRTGEKIKYFTGQSFSLSDEFIIEYDDRLSACNKIYFGFVKNIDYEDYLKECDEIDKKNILLKNRNNKVPKIMKEIEKLNHWDDYVIFEGEKYGVPKIFKETHREDDCFGDVAIKSCYVCYGHMTCNKCNKVV